MNILINASNIKKGGGIQVTDSICRELYRFHQHFFVVVLTSCLKNIGKVIEGTPNISVCYYDIKGSASKLLLGRDQYLDGLVERQCINAVLTIFGPSLWRPRCAHLCGFARAQLVIPESPYYARMDKKAFIKQRIQYGIKEFAFKLCAHFFYSENPYITKKLNTKWKNKRVFTVTNYYNQVFDQLDKWVTKQLTPFSGTTILTISAPYPHKNLEMAAAATKILKERYPDFKFRFVFTIDRKDFDAEIGGMENCFEFIGSVCIEECPSLYEQCDIVFLPTLLECFTAAYPEAMRMGRPIVTTDMEFAKGLCGNAAEYYSAVDAEACADAIFKIASDKEYALKLVTNGKEQLKSYDNYNDRAEKLIKILEDIVN